MLKISNVTWICFRYIFWVLKQNVAQVCKIFIFLDLKVKTEPFFFVVYYDAMYYFSCGFLKIKTEFTLFRVLERQFSSMEEHLIRISETNSFCDNGHFFFFFVNAAYRNISGDTRCIVLIKTDYNTSKCILCFTHTNVLLIS